MKYKCKRCGDVVEEEELYGDPYYEDRGEFWGTSCGEVMQDVDYSCKHCRKGEYEEAYECIDCGEYFLSEELYEGMCIECLKEKLTDSRVIAYCKYEDIYSEYLELKEQSLSNEEIMEQLDAWDNFAWWLKYKEQVNE